MARVEFGDGRRGAAPFEYLAQRSGLNVEEVAEMAARNELGMLFGPDGTLRHYGNDPAQHLASLEERRQPLWLREELKPTTVAEAQASLERRSPRHT